MIVIRYAVSDPQQEELRRKFIEAHKAYLRSTSLRILISGPASVAGQGATAAGLLIAEVDSMTELEDFNKHDPFVMSGVYADVWLLEWHPSIGRVADLFASPPHR